MTEKEEIIENVFTINEFDKEIIGKIEEMSFRNRIRFAIAVLTKSRIVFKNPKIITFKKK